MTKASMTPSRGLVAFCGRIGSGKSFAARHLVETHGYHKLSFADPLKMAVSHIFGWTPDVLSGSTAESRAAREEVDAFWSKAFGRPVSPRRILQEFGTEAVRNWQDNVWVKAMEKRVEEGRIMGEAMVIDDCRFDNEAKMVNQVGGTVVRLTVPHDLCQGDEVAAHASENGVGDDLVDEVLVNRGREHTEEFTRRLDRLVLY